MSKGGCASVRSFAGRGQGSPRGLEGSFGQYRLTRSIGIASPGGRNQQDPSAPSSNTFGKEQRGGSHPKARIDG